MIMKHLNLRWLEVYILGLLSISPHIIGVLSTESSLFRHGLQDVAEEKLGYDALHNRAKRDLFQEKNRDGNLPPFPLVPDLRLQSSYIVNAHEVLRVGLQQFLGFKDADLGTYLNDLIYKRTEPFVDEYGQVIRVYRKVFRFIWEQYNETRVQNYAVKRFSKDKLDLCSVARYLSHQPTVVQRATIMKRMGDALEYRCHPCTPYTPKEFDETIVPSTDDINPEGVSPEESLILCKESQIQGQGHSPSLDTSTTSQGIMTTIMESINPQNTAFDYSPCGHTNGNVVCNKVPLEEVQKAFRRTPFPRLLSVKLVLQPDVFSETIIPEDVFGTKRILDISIEYELSSCCYIKLQVDADAFRSTKSYTNQLKLYAFDCILLDLGFLSGFDKMTELKFGVIDNIQHCFPSLPPLPNLNFLEMTWVKGMNHLNSFPTLTNGLKVFRLFGDVNNMDKAYNDETVDRIMDWLLLSSSDTLEEIKIADMNQLTQVSLKISSFKALRKLWLYDNSISTIKSGAFSFSVPVSELTIRGNGIREIEPGAFHGDFKDAEVYVFNNNLTRFEESVFGPILQQMASGKGFISASPENGNPIDCSDGSICHLTWLKNYEVDVKFWLKCSNGTSFKDLQPAGFNHCP